MRRLAPLSGAAAVLMTFAAFVVGGSAPKGTASVTTVVSFYTTHENAQKTSGIVMSLGAFLFLLFATTRPGRNALSLAGAIIVTAGLIVYAGLAITLADVAGHIDGSALQGLNVLDNDAVFVFLITIGASAFLFGVSGSTALPRWLGMFAFVFAIVGLIPSHVIGGTLDHIGILAFAGLGLWTLLATGFAARRSAAPPA